MDIESGQSPAPQEQCVHRWLIEGHGETHTETCKLCGATKTIPHTKPRYNDLGRYTGKRDGITPNMQDRNRDRKALTHQILRLKMGGLNSSQIAEELGMSSFNLDDYPRRFIDTMEIAAPDERIALHRAIRKAVASEKLNAPSHLSEETPDFEEVDRMILNQYGGGLAIDVIAQGMKRDASFVSVKCKEIIEVTGAMTSLGLAAWLGREDLRIRHSFQE